MRGHGLPAQSFADFHVGFRHFFDRFVIRHTLDLKNAFGAERLYPEYVRRNINEIPDGQGRRFSYGISCVF